LKDIEPELQVGIAQHKTEKRYRVSAPFGRVWLVEILDSKRQIDTPKGYLEENSKYLEALAITLKPTTYSGTLFDPLPQIALLEKPNQVRILDDKLPVINPIIAEVGTVKLRFATIYAANLFLFDPITFPEIEKNLNQNLETWINSEVVRQGLPYAGAGTESGLENYLAARVKVSEVQIKDYFNKNQSKYLIGKVLDESDFPCVFKTLNYANSWQQIFSILPASNWIYDIPYPLNSYCDVEGESDVQLSLPEKPSRSSLQPIPGGFMSRVFKYEKGFAFLVLYGYTPTPLLKPFDLARGEVERDYRLLVAKKQLPNFKRTLYARTNAQNLLKQALAELEK
jgi:hypothetical protein